LVAQKRSFGRRLASGLGFLATTALVAALLIEFGVRVLLPQQLNYDVRADLYREDAELGWRRAADTSADLSRDGLTIRICTDDRGDRIDCARPTRRDCAKHVLIVGDSFVEAVFVPWAQTAWARMERATGACVHVAGVGGYGLSQYLGVVRERLAEPDAAWDLVVLNLYAGNDFVGKPFAVPSSDTVRRAPWRLLPQGLGYYELREWLHPLNQLLESRSHAWVAVRNRLLAWEWQLFVHRSLRPSWFSEERADANLAPVREIADELRRAGVPLLITLVPIQKQVLDPQGEQIQRAVPEVAGDLDMDLPSRRMSPRLRSLERVSYVDLLPGLRERAGPEHYGRNDSHFSGTGHELWFDLIRAPVLELLALSRAEEPK
jgi:hypothetical protein